MRFNISDAVSDLKVKKSRADKLSINVITKHLLSIGFECIRCGECCNARFGDNMVILFPDEIQMVLAEYRMTRDEVCTPSMPQFIDSKGIIHTFEWVLNRHSNGDCIFIEDNKTCMIYPKRPWICSTYPFFLGFTSGAIKPDIMVSECKGVGRPMKEEDAIKLAGLLKSRLLAEITEEIRLLENLEGFEDWEPITDYSIQGYSITVHDSRGITYITG